MNNNIITFSDFTWIVGSHISAKSTLTQTVQKAIDYGMYAFQFFMGSPQSYKRKVINIDDISSAKKLTEKFPMCVFSHAPYIYNLCGSKSSRAWNGDYKQDAKTIFALEQLQYELSILSNFKVNGVVIHPGCFKDRTIGLQTISQSINKMEFTDNSRLLLETSAGQGDTLATSFQEIKTIIDGINDDKRKHIGVCVDTAHVFGSGEYEVSKLDEVKRLFKEFDEVLGAERFSLLHLNDSSVKFKSRTDRHELIGNGYIWGESLTSFIYLMNECERRKIPVVLETSPEDMATLLSIYRNQ